VSRSCVLCAVLIALVVAAPAWAGGSGRSGAEGAARTLASPSHPARAEFVPAGLAGAPLLTEWWRGVLSISSTSDEHPWTARGCKIVNRFLAIDYGGTCTVRQGTWIFEVVATVECSNIEDDPYHADTPLQAAACGFRNNRPITKATVSIDGGPSANLLRGYGTFMLPARVVVPEDGVFGGTPGEIMRYGGHGYVGFVKPLQVGEHTLDASVEGPTPDLTYDYRTTIVVTR
jgi:hypothetical protein